VRPSGRLYSDSLSLPDGPAASYEALMRHNTRLMVDALRAR
jgi:zinc/manganese transport system substrate-binding protein